MALIHSENRWNTCLGCFKHKKINFEYCFTLLETPMSEILWEVELLLGQINYMSLKSGFLAYFFHESILTLIFQSRDSEINDPCRFVIKVVCFLLVGSAYYMIGGHIHICTPIGCFLVNSTFFLVVHNTHMYIICTYWTLIPL